MQKYNMALIQPTTEYVYPNIEAHAELKAMMMRGERVNLSFGIDRLGYEVAYPQSKTTDWFGYQWKSRCRLPPVGGKKLTPSSK